MSTKSVESFALCRSIGDIVGRNARVVRQPGDGSCLYHSLSYGLPGMFGDIQTPHPGLP